MAKPVEVENLGCLLEPSRNTDTDLTSECRHSPPLKQFPPGTLHYFWKTCQNVAFFCLSDPEDIMSEMHYSIGAEFIIGFKEDKTLWKNFHVKRHFNSWVGQTWHEQRHDCNHQDVSYLSYAVVCRANIQKGDLRLGHYTLGHGHQNTVCWNL